MFTFKDYLTESVKKYTFRVKVANDLTTEQETKLKGLLDRFSVAEFTKSGKTPIQSLPLDFPKLKKYTDNSLPTFNDTLLLIKLLNVSL